MSRRNSALLILLMAAVALIPMAGAGYAEEQAALPKDPVVVNGDQVEYYQEKKEVVGTGNVSITYKDVVLTCHKITVNLQTSQATAEGNVKITQKDAYFAGDKIVYNFETRQGSVDNGYLNAPPFYGKAGNMAKAPNKDEYSLKNGYITTCELDKPHYRIAAQQVEVYLGQKVVAKNIIFYVGNLPILYLPYYVQPIQDEKKSHITIIPGQSKDWGYYALGAYRYYINDDSKGDILLDYRSKKGLAEGINHYIKNDQIGEGAFKFYYTHESDNFAFEKSGPVRDRWRYQYRHRWDIKDTDTTAIVEFNDLSDPDIIKDYFYREYEEIGAVPDNYISFITSKRDFSTELTVRKRMNKFFTVVERLPEYKIDILNYRLGDSSFYYSGQASGTYLNQTYATSDPMQKDVGTVRFDAYNQVAYQARFFNALNVTPYAGIRETYYSRNKWGDTNLVRTLFTEGVDNSIRFYRIYDVQSDFMGIDINKLRHVIMPSVNYYHTHQPTIAPENLNQYDAIDAYDTANGFKLLLENKLQTKRPTGPGGDMQSVDLLRFIVSSDYQFRLEKNNWNMKSNKFDSVEFKLELIPYPWLYMTSDMSVSPKRSKIQSASYDIVANGGDKWSLATSFRYEDTLSGRSSLISLDGVYRLNEKWKVRTYQRYNANKSKFEEQEYTVYRDLHCWIVEFTYGNKDDFTNHYFFMAFTLKAFPDTPIGLRQTYSRPRFGSTGDTP